MALTQPQKNALDAMNNVDKALVILYVFGVDDNALAGTIGTEFISAYYPNIETPTNNQKAKAVLAQVKNFIKSVYVSRKADSAANTARDTAIVNAQDDFVFSATDPAIDD